MNDLMIDLQLKRYVAAVVHSCAEPLPLLTRSDRRWSGQPAVAFASAFATVMLTVGLGIVVWSIGSPDTVQEPSVGGDYSNGDIEAYWNWMTTGAEQLEPNDLVPDPDVVGVKQTGPTPKFIPSDLGEVQRILSRAELSAVGEVYFDDEFPMLESEFVPPVAYIGTLEGTSTQIVLYRAIHIPSGELFLCLAEQNRGSSGVSCMAQVDLDNDGFPWTVSHSGSPTPIPTVRVAMVMLPSQTAVVVVTVGDGRTFVQRPVGGVAVIEFVGSDGSLPISVEALDKNGDLLARDHYASDALSKGVGDS